MRLKNLETFVAVVKCGSFRAAAERLYTTQPAVSARIAQLEDELGVELFDRSKRAISLKPKGYQLLPYAERMLALNAELELEVGTESSYKGVVRLGTSETLLHTWVPALLNLVHERFPQISVELEVDTTLGLRNSLARGEIDIAFLMGPVSEPTMRNLPLNNYELVWAASPSLGLPDKRLSLAEVTEHSLLTYPRQTRPYVALREIVRKSDLALARINTSSSLATIMHMAINGSGVTALPKEVMKPHLEQGTLKLLDVDCPLPDLEFTVTYPPSDAQPFLEILAEMATAIAMGLTDK